MATMNNKQQQLFTEIMQSGWSMGCEHPVEAYMNYVRMAWQLYVPEEARKRERYATETMIAFLRGTDSSPTDPVKNADDQYLVDLIGRYYGRSHQTPNP